MMLVRPFDGEGQTPFRIASEDGTVPARREL